MKTCIKSAFDYLVLKCLSKFGFTWLFLKYFSLLRNATISLWLIVIEDIFKCIYVNKNSAIKKTQKI